MSRFGSHNDGTTRPCLYLSAHRVLREIYHIEQERIGQLSECYIRWCWHLLVSKLQLQAKPNIKQYSDKAPIALRNPTLRRIITEKHLLYNKQQLTSLVFRFVMVLKPNLVVVVMYYVPLSKAKVLACLTKSRIARDRKNIARFFVCCLHDTFELPQSDLCPAPACFKSLL